MSGVARLGNREAVEPLVRLAPALNGLAGKSLLDGLRIDYGPVDLLGRFFLKADAALRERGIAFSFGALDELIEVNRRNSNTWKPLVTVFDPTFGGIKEDNSFVMLGRDRTGEVVATQAARFYNWANSDFATETSSLRLFYPDPSRQKLPAEAMEVTAKSARKVRGRVAFSGGVWIRPDYRGRFLTAIMPRISRANAFTRWYTDVTVTMMSQALVDKGLAARCGYTDVDNGVTFRNTRLGTLSCALLQMETNEMLDDLGRFSEHIDAQVDRRIENRAG